MKLLPTILGQKINVKNDIVAGLITAAVSIPIAMGYAQIAGLPAVYGLYGSVLPIQVFALISTSPHMIFGVDAAPAALTGSVLVSLGITAESKMALTAVPLITLCTACWLLLFSLLVSFDGCDLATSFTASLSCLSNIGPGMTRAIGPAGNFAFFSDRTKLLLSLAMLMGRLEIYPILVLLSPRTWKR